MRTFGRLGAHVIAFLILLWCSGSFLAAQTPQWIWLGSDAPGGTETVFLRKTFRTPPLIWNSRLTVAADDSAEVFLNGISVATCSGPQEPVRAEVTVRLNQGENVIAVRATNRTGPAGILVILNLGGETNVVSDGSWLVTTNEEKNWSALKFNASHWAPATSLAAQGAGVWGDVLSRGAATPAASLAVAPGFKVELLRAAQANEGSWICMAFDRQGRLVVSPQGDERPLLRFEVTNGGVGRVDTIAAPLRYAMGLLYAHGSLYANARGPAGAGLYRLIDTNSNDQFEAGEMQLLKKFDGGSEHGYHALGLGPDGKIYVMNGNGTKLAKELSSRSPHRNFAEDVLSINADEGPRSETPAPAGHVLRTDLDGRQWELWMGGLRNAYDFDFNGDGELFTFDSDMEWDWGTPWYRPTRIVHGVSGGEYGWRDGPRLWPDSYEDSLPGVVNVGIGSPTGLKFGTRSQFPEKYRRALFALDWSYGKILAIHLQPAGASYRGTVESFLSGAPLNLTDVEFGPDGAMYFITGGRGTQSGLYRVTFSGSAASEAAEPKPDKDAEEARGLRRRLERLHGTSEPEAVPFIWPHLGSKDRFIRYAARVALEAQDLSVWKERALAEANPTAGLTALLALARRSGPETQAQLLKGLTKFPLEELDEELTLLKLRVIELSFLRQGRPGAELARMAVEKLGRRYPAKSWPVNRELSRLLIYLDAPAVIPKTLALMEAAATQEEQFHYVAQLRNLRRGWSLAERERFFGWWLKPRDRARHLDNLPEWFGAVGRSYVDGAWVNKYLREFRADAIATLTPEERRDLAPLLAQPFEKARLLPSIPRAFVRDWTLAELTPELERATRRSFERGQQVFADAQCLACHRFGNDGGSAGPELTGAGSKYDSRSLLESIVEPSKVINEQYRNTIVVAKDGETVVGRLVSDAAGEVVLETDVFNGTRQSIPRAQIQEVLPSNISPMPAGLLNVLHKEEILDLLAYLRSGGKREAPMFKTP